MNPQLFKTIHRRVVLDLLPDFNLSEIGEDPLTYQTAAYAFTFEKVIREDFHELQVIVEDKQGRQLDVRTTWHITEANMFRLGFEAAITEEVRSGVCQAIIEHWYTGTSKEEMMSELDYIKETYRVPAREGVGIRLWGPSGPSEVEKIERGEHVIISESGKRYHPTYRVEYVDLETGERLWPNLPEEMEESGLEGEDLSMSSKRGLFWNPGFMSSPKALPQAISETVEYLNHVKKTLTEMGENLPEPLEESVTEVVTWDGNGKPMIQRHDENGDLWTEAKRVFVVGIDGSFREEGVGG